MAAAEQSVASAWKQIRLNRELRKRARDKAQLLTDSFRSFVPQAWPIVEPTHKFIPAWHIDAIADHMQAMADGHIQNLLILVPPGSAKSLLVSVMWPAWMWTPGRRPGWRSTWISYNDSLASRDSERCRGLMKSMWYRETFEPDWEFSRTQDEKTYYVNTAKGFRVAGASTGWRGSHIGADDPLDAADRHSDLKLAKCIDTWENVMFNRLDDINTGTKVVIMQRLVDRDLGGHLLRKGGCEVLMIPVEYNPSRSRVTTLAPGKEWRDPRTVKGELMCPEKFPPSFIEELKTTKEETFQSQYQQEPTPEGGGILKSYQWRYWRPRGLALPPVRVKLADGSIEERNAVELPDSFDLVLQSWDCAFKGLKDSDFVVGQVHGVRGANRFILDQIRRRLDFPATLNAIRELTGRWPDAHLKSVEDKANGSAVMDTLRDEIAGLIAENEGGSKEARAQAAAVELQSGNWYLPHPMVAPWVGNPESPTDTGFLAETVAFPFGVNDDQCFPAGTMIATSRGNVPIESVLVGDLVITPYGLSTVSMSGCTGKAVISSRWPIRATGRHKIFTWDSGFLTLDSLSQGAMLDKLSLCGLIRWNALIRLTSLGEDSNSWAGRSGIISASQIRMTEGGVLRACTSQFGKCFMGRRLPGAAIFITKTITHSITILKIWSAYRRASIGAYIRSKILKNKHLTWLMFGRSQQNGIVPNRDGYGTARTLSGNGKNVSPLSMFVGGAIARLMQSGQRSTVAASADTNTARVSDTTMSPNLAMFVGRNSRPSSTSIHPEPDKHAVESVNQYSEEPVYNLKVEPAGVYYANGILVSNCDAWSQGASRIKKEKIGGVFGVSEKDIRVEPFEFAAKWPRIYGLSITWKEVGAVWMCREPETSQYYAYAEYGAPLSDPAHHVGQIRKVGDWIPGVVHAAEGNRTEQDGYALINKYSGMGLKLVTIPDGVESEIMDVQDALRTGKLKVFGNLGRFFDQYRMFRRDDKGKLPSYNVGVVQALCVAWRGRDRMKAPAEPAKVRELRYMADSPDHGWMGG